MISKARLQSKRGNPYHVPAGSPKGGEFTHGPSGVSKERLTKASGYKTSFKVSYGNHELVDVYKNPTNDDLKTLRDKGRELSGFITGKTSVVMFTGSLHEETRQQTNLVRKDSIPFRLYDDAIMVTDNIKHSDKWNHSPALKAYIQSNIYLKRKFGKLQVSYYDEAVVGDWAKK